MTAGLRNVLVYRRIFMPGFSRESTVSITNIQGSVKAYHKGVKHKGQLHKKHTNSNHEMALNRGECRYGALILMRRLDYQVFQLGYSLKEEMVRHDRQMEWCKTCK